MNPKRIVNISPAHPFKGGIAASAEPLAIELNQTGNAVTLLTLTSQYPTFLFPGESQFSCDQAKERIKYSWDHLATEVLNS